MIDPFGNHTIAGDCLFNYIRQLGEFLALFEAENFSLFCVAEGDNQANRGIEVAKLTELFVIKPTEDAGAAPLGGRLGGDIGGEDTDINLSFFHNTQNRAVYIWRRIRHDRSIGQRICGKGKAR